MKKTLQKRLAILVFLLGIAGNLLAQNMTLVSETDFSCSQKPDAHIASIEDVDGFGNSLIKPSLSTSLTLATSTESTTTKSDFLSKAQYAITSDPIHLDSLRMIDTNEWGFVTSSTNVKQSYLVMTVNGLKDNSKYRVEIEYAVPLTDDAIQSSFYNVALRAIVNPDQYNAETNGEMGHGLDLNNIKEGQTETLVITQNSMSSSPISDGTLKLYINTVKGALGQAIMIKSIKVYGTVETEIQGKESICTESARPVIYANGKDVKSIRLKSGESVTLTSNDVTTMDINGEPYTDFTMSWHKDDATSKALKTNKGVVADSLVVKWEDADKNGTTFILKVQDNTLNANGEKIDDCNSYDTIIVYADAAPETGTYCLDENGNPMSQKIIWQDDFGTFTSGTEYWTWDYTDLSNPKKVTHQTSGSDKWITDLPYNIPGAVYNNETNGGFPRPEGWYRVVSFLSDQGGANLGWTAQAYDGTYPNKSKYALKKDGVSYFPDHTYEDTSAMGGMLMLNMGCYQGDVIYQRVIRSIKEKKLTFRCYINTFSDTYETPVAIYVRATEVDDSGQPVGTPHVSDVVEKLASKDPVSTDWKEVKVEFELTQYSNVSVEIITNVGDGIEGIDNATGNDLLLDDIQLLACTEMKDPDPDPTIIKCTESTQPIIYANGKNVKSIRLKSGESVTLTSNDVTTMDINGEPYTDFTMSWHKDDATSKALKTNKGVVADSLVVKWEDADKNGTTFILKVQDNTLNANGEKIDDCNSYDTIIVYADADTVPEIELYCEDYDGTLFQMELIWQEDFGTFESANYYWMWDYSDIDNPVKFSCTTPTKWTTCVELAPEANVECDTAPSIEGKYCVAANVTCAYDNAQDGTQWGREAYFGNGQSPKKNGWTFIPDHTYGTSAYGGMLFINCNNEQETPIYTKRFTRMQERYHTALCYVNTFSANENPVEIYLQVKDLTTGDIYKSERVRKSSTDGKNWAVARVDFAVYDREMELSVISCGGGESYNKNGNDLVLDDIQIYMCTDSEHVGVETQPAAEMDELVNVYTISGIIVKSNVKRSEALNGLKKGSYYIVGHEKVLVDL